MAKVICVCAYETNGRIGVPKPYLDALSSQGAYPVLVSSDPQKASEIADGILLVGGGDISPEVLPSKRPELLTDCDPKRDLFELELCKIAVEKSIPLLGICKGCQIINAALGGTLIEDISAAGFRGDIHHRVHEIEQAVHPISIEKSSLLYSMAGQTNTLSVNSTHHQACGTLADCLKPAAYAQDGILEAFEGKNSAPILGIQFHPERLLNQHILFQNIYKWLAYTAQDFQK